MSDHHLYFAASSHGIGLIEDVQVLLYSTAVYCRIKSVSAVIPNKALAGEYEEKIWQ